jgi:hypothetical protein
MGLGEADLAGISRFLQRSAAGSIGDFAACRPGYFETGSQTAAHGAQRIQAGRNGDAVQFN